MHKYIKREINPNYTVFKCTHCDQVIASYPAFMGFHQQTASFSLRIEELYNQHLFRTCKSHCEITA